MGTVHQLVESQNLFTVGSEQSVSEAARVLASNNIGALPVVADGRLVGILSERDIIQKIVAGVLLMFHKTFNPRRNFF